MKQLSFTFIRFGIAASFFWMWMGLWGQTSDKELADAYLDSATVMIKQAKFDMAIEHGQKALELYQQIFGEEDTLVAKAHYVLGRTYRIKRKFSEALFHHNQSVDISKRIVGKTHLSIAASYNELGLIHRYKGEYGDAQKAYNEALAIYEELLGDDHVLVAKIYNNLGVIAEYTGKYDQALKFQFEGLKILLGQLDSLHQDLGDFYINIGNVYRLKGEYQRALENYQQSLKIQQLAFGKEHPKVAASFHNMGVAYRYQGDYDKALRNYQHAYDIWLKTYGAEHTNIGIANLNIGEIYMRKKDFLRAFQSFQAAHALWERKLGDAHPNLAHTHSNLGEIHMEYEEYDKALDRFAQVERILSSSLGDKHPRMANVYQNVGRVYHKKGEYPKALASYHRGLSIMQQALGKDHSDIGSYYINLGTVFLESGQIDSAIAYFEKNLINRQQSYHEGHPLLSQAYNRLGLASYHQKEYNKAVEYYTTGLRNLNQMYRRYRLSGTKQIHLAENYSLFENGIKAILAATNTGSTDMAIREALFFSEHAKSNLLLETMYASKAKTFSGIPDVMLKAEDQLSTDLALTEKKRIEAMEKGGSTKDSLLAVYNSKFFDLNQSYNTLIQQIETKYPDYYTLKYDRTVSNVSEIQSFLPDTSLLIEYFLGDSNLFIFAISQDTVVLHQKEIQGHIREDVQDYLSLIKEPSDDPLTPRRIGELGYRLYRALLAPVLEENHFPNLIIIPDGILGYLPFDLLLTKPIPPNASYRDFPYLLRGHEVRYEYSATLLLQEQKTNKANASYAGFAPEYALDHQLTSGEELSRAYPTLRAGFSPLAHNQAEVQRAAQTLEGQSFLGKDASESSFKIHSSGKQMLHLAMHALLHDSLPQYSGLVFSQELDSTEDHFLYAYELYKMQLDAELAVLSACETGLGKIQRGEGIMSLARAFKYAGCPNIVMSLWKADDRATADIIVDFFANLKAGMPKAAALRKAKLAYLDQAPAASSHPFYWGTFVLIGDDTPIDMPRKWWPWLIGMLAFGILLMFMIKKGRNAS